MQACTGHSDVMNAIRLICTALGVEIEWSFFGPKIEFLQNVTDIFPGPASQRINQ